MLVVLSSRCVECLDPASHPNRNRLSRSYGLRDQLSEGLTPGCALYMPVVAHHENPCPLNTWWKSFLGENAAT